MPLLRALTVKVKNKLSSNSLPSPPPFEIPNRPKLQQEALKSPKAFEVTSRRCTLGGGEKVPKRVYSWSSDEQSTPTTPVSEIVPVEVKRGDRRSRFREEFGDVGDSVVSIRVYVGENAR
jgi:hypothetical protein